MRRAVYIGAGLDIMPTLLFPKIKEFVYIDSLPFSAYGNIAYNAATNNIGEEHVYYATRDQRTPNSYSRPDFLPRLRSIFRQNEFSVAEENPDYLLFRRGNQDVYYFYSCGFPNHITPAISAKLSGADTLIIAGHDPHHNVLEYVSPPINLIANNRTVYSCDPSEDDYATSTIRELQENPILLGDIYKIYGQYVPYDSQTAAEANKWQVIKIDRDSLFK